MIAPGLYPGINGWQVGHRRAIAMHLVGQVLEIDTVEMTAVIVNIILTALFSVGRDINAAIDLVLDRFASRPDQRFIGHLVGIVLGIAESACYSVILLLGFGEVADLDIVGFRVSTDAGCTDSHQLIIMEEG